MSRRELDVLFAASSPGRVPAGLTRGTVLVATGTLLARPLAKIAGALAWKGKVFSADGASLVNLVTPFAVHAVRANVHVDKSLSDGAPCIVIDYSKTSFIAKFVRDEIREVEPDIFLGKAYVLGLPTVFFALETMQRLRNS